MTLTPRVINQWIAKALLAGLLVGAGGSLVACGKKAPLEKPQPKPAQTETIKKSPRT